MQSIFSPAARRGTLGVRATFDRRDGELKMDWTKPLHYRSALWVLNGLVGATRAWPGEDSGNGNLPRPLLQDDPD